VTVFSVLTLVVAALFALLGLRAAFNPVRLEDDASTGVRVLVALHDASRAGFWLALAGLFVGFALLEDPNEFRWFAFIPLAMAAIRLVTAARLSRG
jgi:hypothetical protein